MTYSMPSQGYPAAEIRTGQHTDGRWMWAITIMTGRSGHSYALLPKWDRFAATSEAALLAAAQEIRQLLEGWTYQSQPAAVNEINSWLDGVVTELQQPSLFGSAA